MQLKLIWMMLMMLMMMGDEWKTKKKMCLLGDGNTQFTQYKKFFWQMRATIEKRYNKQWQRQLQMKINLELSNVNEQNKTAAAKTKNRKCEREINKRK